MLITEYLQKLELILYKKIHLNSIMCVNQGYVA